MPFLTRNPYYYLSALEEDSTDPLHIGLFLGGENNDVEQQQQAESESSSTAILAESLWVELATAIQQTKRSIRCIWLRVKGEGGDDTTITAIRALGQGLVGATAIESLVLEDQGIGMDQLEFLSEYMTRNTTLRGVKFLRTHLDTSSALLLNNFFCGNPALRVLDLTCNPRVDDETVRGILDAILRNGSCRLETLNIFEKMEGDADAEIGISEGGVDTIVSFVSRSK